MSASQSISKKEGKGGIYLGCSEPILLDHVSAEAKATAKNSHVERPVQGWTLDVSLCFYPQPIFTGQDGDFIQSQFGQKGTIYASKKDPFKE